MLRRIVVDTRLKNTVDAQALAEVARVHANLNRLGGLPKLSIREGISNSCDYNRLPFEPKTPFRVGTPG